MKSKGLNVLSVILILGLLTSCIGNSNVGADIDDETEVAERVKNPVYAEAKVPNISEANNAFAFDFLPLLANSQESNLFYSPYSIASAVGMAYNGAVGATKEEMAEVFHWEDISAETFNIGQKYLYNALNSKENVTINVANSIWRNDVNVATIKDSFINDNKEVFDASYDTLDLSKQKSIDKINQWISERTEEMIPNMLQEPFDEDTAMLLINGVYFYGDWLNEFDKEATYEQIFHGSSGNNLVQMMHQSETFRYGQGEGYQSIVLPYKNWEAQMVIVMPTDMELDTFLAELNEETYMEVLSQSNNTTVVNLTMPKFKIETDTISLVKPLQELGMNRAFDPYGADFSGISEEALTWQMHINEVLHKAVIEVDEVGTEAAAVTVVEMTTESAMEEEQPVVMTIDRPFVFFITDPETDTILFVGAIRDL